MSTTRTLISGAVLALAITLGASAPALADFDHDRRWTPGPPPPQSWQPRHPPAYGRYSPHGWVWVCNHRQCGWAREMRRYWPPRYAQPPRFARPIPRHRVPPIAWQPPLGTIHLQLNF